jgi:hypothetical protein
VGLDAAAPSLGDMIESVRTGLEAVLTQWLPPFLFEPISASEGRTAYAPLEFFLGLVLILGVVVLCCGVLGVIRATLLRSTATRLEALVGEREILAPETMKHEFLRAFRGSRRSSRTAESYVETLKVVPGADGDTLISAHPARGLFTVEEVVPSIEKKRADRLLGAIVGLGAVVIIVELAIGLLRFRAEFSDAGAGVDGLIDPAMSGAIYALGCVVVTAAAVGLYRVIGSSVEASLVRLQAMIDALFYRPAGALAADGPRLAWPTGAISPRARLLDEPPPREPEPVLALDLDRPTVAPERGDPMKSRTEVERETIAAAEFERTTGEMRALVAALNQDVSHQRDTLGEVLTRLNEPVPPAEPPIDLTQLRESTAELALLADATRESIMQLAQITENLSRVVTVLVEHATEAATASAAPATTPGEPTPDVVNELRDMLRAIDAADISTAADDDNEATFRS